MWPCVTNTRDRRLSELRLDDELSARPFLGRALLLTRTTAPPCPPGGSNLEPTLLQGARERIRLGFMPRKPRVLSCRVLEIAELIDRETRARTGPNATFEQRQNVAATVAAEMLAEFAKQSGGTDEPTGEG